MLKDTQFNGESSRLVAARKPAPAHRTPQDRLQKLEKENLAAD
jgi:hypothetical protein